MKNSIHVYDKNLCFESKIFAFIRFQFILIILIGNKGFADVGHSFYGPENVCGENKKSGRNGSS